MVNYKCAKCDKDGCTKGCGTCKSLYYCSKKCQAAHWKEHKKSCNVLAVGMLAVWCSISLHFKDTSLTKIYIK